MVEDTLKSNALPENFSRKTVEKAVEEARKLNLESKFSEAEQVLRDALSKAPGHPGALRELNRSLMQGQVYGASRWDILPEVVEHGRAILASGEDDEYVYHELARTLLAIAAMPEAVEFIAGWIEKKGPNLERLGMLAWARGCVADYDAAESTWNELMALAQNASRDEIRDAVPQACDALVDCLSAAGEMSRAARVVKAGWDLCRAYGAISAKTGIDAISQWPYLFKQAGLETECILAARAWLAIAEARPEHHARVKWEPICARAWFDDPVSVTSDWLQWVRERIEARDWTRWRRQDVPWHRRSWELAGSTNSAASLKRHGNFSKRRQSRKRQPCAKGGTSIASMPPATGMSQPEDCRLRKRSHTKLLKRDIYMSGVASTISPLSEGSRLLPD